MKNQFLRNTSISLTSVLIFLLHFPLVFAKSRPFNEIMPGHSKMEASLPGDSLQHVAKSEIQNAIPSLYDSMHLDGMGLSKRTFDYAIKGFNYLVQTGRLNNDKIISIIDFSLPSTEKRLFVIDLNMCKVVFRTYVAHGINSGVVSANEFSNRPESNKSSLGFYETLNTYTGSHGYSLRLDGLEKGINDNANRRDIVIHGAAYVDESLIKLQGYIGRSLGCPALPEKLHKPIIDKIKNGTCLFIYSPDISYLKKSKILNADS